MTTKENITGFKSVVFHVTLAILLVWGMAYSESLIDPHDWRAVPIFITFMIPILACVILTIGGLILLTKDEEEKK